MSPPHARDHRPTLTDADLAALRDGAGAACGFLRALAHEDRLMLLCQLSQGECSVRELEARVGLGQPSLSQQLGILRRQELVVSRAEGAGACTGWPMRAC